MELEINLGKAIELFRLEKYQAALSLFTTLALQGDSVAQDHLGWFYQNGLGTPQNYSDAIKWYRMAAEQGYHSGQSNLGWMYEYGLGVDVDYGQALNWYQKSAAQGNALSMNQLGWMYQHGFGVTQDYAEAVRWYQEAANHGNSEGQNNLGWMYEYGFGVNRDLHQALRFYRFAANQGNTAAKSNVLRLDKEIIISSDSSNKHKMIQGDAINNRKNIKDVTSILFLSADPSNESRLRLGEELREIQEKLQMAKLRGKFNLDQRMSIRPADISQALLDVQPQIVHFSGHGTNEGSLCFENEIGKSHFVQPEALASLFELVTDHVDCVLLNACYSEIQAKAIANHISYVIGMNKSIGDKAAISFAIGFYQALGAGKSVEDAYKFGCVQIRLHNISEHLTPVLIKKP
ncbi:tetratricopeptide repeat protein [Nostoc sp. TCL240-02]|uniref:tetratricopeptide repeat protein n=1 Tax=Nostoc sp. TCL240-02 TaxID=2572090 RepID=UPI00157FB6B4|nr:tetratricopeptide repeat protein [Nostoc sp. TCL240-02]QKQ74010.1 sel1 repeat family protein [Nostoc sp. TCL240-02]